MLRGILLPLLLLPQVSLAEVFVLGSSYSWDARPPLLADSNVWHIDCGRTLQHIWDHPLTPCQATSTAWSEALAAGPYEFISFQPVPGVGGTRAADVAAISAWMAMQPDAIGVIHPTWGWPVVFDEQFHDSGADHEFTNPSREYYEVLLDDLRRSNPGRVFLSDRGIEMLDAIYHDIDAGVGPLENLSQVFRDAPGHLTHDVGAYLMHNALRQAFRQEVGVNAEALGIDAATKLYLDGVVRTFAPQPSLPFDPTRPEGTGTLQFSEKTRTGRGCANESALRTADLTLEGSGAFLLKHAGVDLRGMLRKLDRRGRKWALDLDEDSVTAYAEFLRGKADGLCGGATVVGVTAQPRFEIRYAGEERLSIKVRTRGSAHAISREGRLTHKMKGRTIHWDRAQPR